jgi:serralysin
MFATTAHGHRQLRRVALLAGLPLVMAGIATAPAQAAVVQCGGWTAADAISHNYDTFEGTAGPDVYTYTGAKAFWAVGKGAGDTIVGGPDLNLICGNDGPDTITTNGSHDQVWGGDGNDQLKLGAGPDFAEGGPGNDDISGGPDADVLYGDNVPSALLPPTTGADTVKGNEGDDELRGGLGADTLKGNEGTDNVFGDDGPDSLDGGTSAGNVDAGDGGPGADVLCVNFEAPLISCP